MKPFDSKFGNLNDSELLVDYMEGEMGPDQKGNFEQVLRSNEESRKALRQLKKLKREIGGIPVDALPSDPDYYDQLADRIMAKVGQTQVQSKTWMMYSKFEVLRYAAAVLLMVAGGWTSLKAISNQHDTRGVMATAAAQNQVRDLLIESAVEEPSIFADTVMTQTDEEDLVMDASAQKLDELSDNERDMFLKALKE